MTNTNCFPFQAKKLSDDILISWRLPYLSGRIHTLQGYSYLKTGRLHDAAEELKAAMSTFGHGFPNHNFSAFLKMLYQKLKLRTVLDIMPKRAIGRSKGYYAHMAVQVAECQTIMFSLFKVCIILRFQLGVFIKEIYFFYHNEILRRMLCKQQMVKV